LNSINWNHAKMESEFNNTFRPKDIETELWLKRFEEDEQNFVEDLPVSIDKRGIVGDNLFSLSLDSVGSDLSRRSISVFTGDLVAKGMFHALCPELESFITLTNWMGASDDRKETRVKYFKEIKRFLDEKSPNKICSIEGNYRIRRGDYSTLNLFRGNVNIKEKDDKFYDWSKAPYIKRSAETFAYFPSPIFMSTVPSGEISVAEDKVSYFTSIFRLKKIAGETATISLFYCTNPHTKEVDVIIKDGDLKEKLEANRDSIFLGLFEEKIYKKKGDFFRDFVILESSDDLSGEEIAGHLVSLRLYYNYLKNRVLFLCTDAELIERCKIVFYHVSNSYKKKINISLDVFIKEFIEMYFIKIDNNWYYRPFILKDLNENEFRDFIKYLNLLKDKKPDMIAMIKYLKYFKQKQHINFLNVYNFYSKRTLINMIETHKDQEGRWKWRV